MKAASRKLTFVICLAAAVTLLLQLPLTTVAQGQDVKADYDRANSLNTRINNKVFDVAGTPTWIDGSPKFWYQKSVKGGNEFVLVDPDTKTKSPAFDHARLATSLSAAATGNYTAVTLPFSTFTFIDNMQAIEFAVGAGGGGGGRGGGGAAAPAGRRRPVKGFGNMMKEAQKLQAQMEKMQEEIARKTVDATAGGGMVTVQANGKQELLSIKIDPEVINKDDAQMLEDLVLAACNEALRKSRELVQQELGKLTGGLKIPGLGM